MNVRALGYSSERERQYCDLRMVHNCSAHGGASRTYETEAQDPERVHETMVKPD